MTGEEATHCGAARQRLAIVLADGSVELLDCVEDDLWEETAEETGSVGPQGLQLQAAPSRFRLPGTPWYCCQPRSSA